MSTENFHSPLQQYWGSGAGGAHPQPDGGGDEDDSNCNSVVVDGIEYVHLSSAYQFLEEHSSSSCCSLLASINSTTHNNYNAPEPDEPTYGSIPLKQQHKLARLLMLYDLLSETDVVLDAGSGFNLPVLHFAAQTMCKGIGMEVAPSRHISAVRCEVEMYGKYIDQKMTDDVVPAVKAVCGDILNLKSTAGFSVMFLFDAVFTPEVKTKLFQLFTDCKQNRLLITTVKNPKELYPAVSTSTPGHIYLRLTFPALAPTDSCEARLPPERWHLSRQRSAHLGNDVWQQRGQDVSRLCA